MKNPFRKKSLFSGLPNVSDALRGWEQPLNIFKIKKTSENFEVKEEKINLKGMGVWQPMSFRNKSILPEGQRAWSWFTVHSHSDLNLDIDDIIERYGVKYRLMNKGSYPEYGYFEYNVCLDAQASGISAYDRSNF